MRIQIRLEIKALRADLLNDFHPPILNQNSVRDRSCRSITSNMIIMSY